MALLPLEPFSLHRILCSSICDDQKGGLLQNRYPIWRPPQRAAYSSDKIWPDTLHPNQSINQSKHRRETTGKRRSLKEPNSLPRRNSCQPFRSRMYFLKAHGMSSHGQLMLLDPFVFCASTSCGALATRTPMAGEVILSRESTQTLPAKLWFEMQDLGSESRIWDKVPTFIMPLGSPARWLAHFQKKRLF